MVGYRDVICYEEYLYDYNHIIAVVVIIHSNSPRYQCYKSLNLEFLNNKKQNKTKNPKIQKAITFTTFYAINIINTIWYNSNNVNHTHNNLNYDLEYQQYPKTTKI
jgi:hypothetical protein